MADYDELHRSEDEIPSWETLESDQELDGEGRKRMEMGLDTKNPLSELSSKNPLMIWKTKPIQI
jgi:hypothetical protein